MATGLKDQQDQKSTTDPSERFDDDALNPGQQDYLNRFNHSLKDVNTPADLLNKAEQQAGEGSSQADSLKDSEESTGFTTDVTRPLSGDTKKGGKSLPLVVIGLLVGLFFGVSIIGMQSLPLHLLNNIFNNNNASGIASAVRQSKVARMVLGVGGDSNMSGVCSGAKIKCKNSNRISNKGLYKLSKSNIVGVIDGKEYDVAVDGKKKYPAKNPQQWKVTDDSGRVRWIKAADMDGYLTQPQNFRSTLKIFGARGAFNMHKNVFWGKHVNRGVYQKLKVRLVGGTSTNATKKPTLPETLAKLEKNIPVVRELSAKVARVNAVISKKIGLAKKGGAGYSVSAGACMAAKIPDLITAASTAIDLAYSVGAANEILLSPSSKSMSNFVHDTFSSADNEEMGSFFTNKVKGDDGVLRAGVDNQHLLFAAGISKVKPTLSSLAPGMKAKRNPAMAIGSEINQQTEDACNAVLSPAAAYGAMAVSAGIAAASATTLIGVVVKVGIDFIVGEATEILLMRAAEAAIGAGADSLSQEDEYQQALEKGGGNESGEIIANGSVGLMTSVAFNSGLSTGTLEDDVPQTAAIIQDFKNQQREIDIATLSPFDISSQYTFLGSIVYNLQNTAVLSGYYSEPNIASFMTGLAQLPAIALSNNTASAAISNDYERKKCSFADEIGIPKTEDGKTMAFQFNAMPCPVMSSAFTDLEPEDAIDRLAAANMFDEEVEINDGDTIFDLLSVVDESKMDSSSINTDDNGQASLTTPDTDIDSATTKKGYIKAGTPLDIYIRECTDMSAGTYIIDAMGCMVTSTAEYSKQVIEAIPIFIIDFVLAQIINGENDDDGQQPQSNTIGLAGPGICPASDRVVSYGQQDGYDKGKLIHITTCGIKDWPSNFENSGKEKIVEVNSDIAAQTAAMAAALKSHSQSNGNYDYTASLGFRTNEQQKCIYDYYISGKKGCSVYNSRPPDAASPGNSNHQMGLSIDLPTGYTCSSPYLKTSIKANQWLNANMSKYGFSRDVGCGDYGHFTGKPMSVSGDVNDL